jgi:hypothetical protein
MKEINFLIILFCLLFSGCSSTYRISDFSSNDKFYEDFNHFAQNKSVKVTLLNDSSFSINDGAKIQNDSLYAIEKDNIMLIKEIDTAEIKELSYNKFQTYALIFLKDGESYQAHDIEFHKDSIHFFYDNKIIKTINISSINKIKNISYKNHWIGIPFGFLGGIIIGALAGRSGLIQVPETEGNAPTITDNNYVGGIYFGMLAGAIAGSVVGWVLGWNFTYEFSP